MSHNSISSFLAAVSYSASIFLNSVSSKTLSTTSIFSIFSLFHSHKSTQALSKIPLNDSGKVDRKRLLSTFHN